jgi:hypothetical protein
MAMNYFHRKAFMQLLERRNAIDAERQRQEGPRTGGMSERSEGEEVLQREEVQAS